MIVLVCGGSDRLTIHQIAAALRPFDRTAEIVVSRTVTDEVRDAVAQAAMRLGHPVEVDARPGTIPDVCLSLPGGEGRPDRRQAYSHGLPVLSVSFDRDLEDAAESARRIIAGAQAGCR